MDLYKLAILYILEFTVNKVAVAHTFNATIQGQNSDTAPNLGIYTLEKSHTIFKDYYKNPLQGF